MNYHQYKFWSARNREKESSTFFQFSFTFSKIISSFIHSIFFFFFFFFVSSSNGEVRFLYSYRLWQYVICFCLRRNSLVFILRILNLMLINELDRIRYKFVYIILSLSVYVWIYVCLCVRVCVYHVNCCICIHDNKHRIWIICS